MPAGLGRSHGRQADRAPAEAASGASGRGSCVRPRSPGLLSLLFVSLASPPVLASLPSMPFCPCLLQAASPRAFCRPQRPGWTPQARIHGGERNCPGRGAAGRPRRRGPLDSLPQVGALALALRPARLAAVQSSPSGTGLGRRLSACRRERGRKCVCSSPSGSCSKVGPRGPLGRAGFGPERGAGRPAPGVYTTPRPGRLGFAEKIGGREGYF